MRELRKQDPALSRLLPPQRLLPEGRYVRSRYALPFEHEGKTLWFNTLTRQLVELEHTLPERVSAGEIEKDAELALLLRGYFLVPEGKDECSFYVGLFRVLHTLVKKSGVKGYTILPTTVCNARCVYCFEEGRRQETMTPETAARTVRYIMETRCPEEIELHWFGGEPLLAVSLIDAICEGLRRADIPYTGSMTTNGSLITPDIADSMAGPWNIKFVQVSMDGDEEDYIARKRYLREGDGYRAALRGIRLLSERGVQVSVRCNVDEENIDGVGSFLSELSEAVPDKKNVDVYLSGLYQSRTGERAPVIWRKIAEARPLIRSFGFQGTDARFRLHDLNNHHCKADMGGVVIGPDGSLYACEFCSEESRFGNIVSETEDAAAREFFCRLDEVREKCRSCPFLPDCTPFRSCPVQDAHCDEIRRLRFQEQVRGFLHGRDREQRSGEALLGDC